MNTNGQPLMPIEINLNSCAVDIIPVNQNGQAMKQVRITHMSGVPVTLVMLLTEEGANAIAKELTGGSPVVIANRLPG
jgi:hypothetical protein